MTRKRYWIWGLGIMDQRLPWIVGTFPPGPGIFLKSIVKHPEVSDAKVRKRKKKDLAIKFDIEFDIQSISMSL